MFLVCSCGSHNSADFQEDLEVRVFELVNEHRSGQGLATLQWSDVITTQCRNHSEDMATGVVPFGHDGFSDRIEEIRKEMSVSGAAENVAYNYGHEDPAQQAVTAWLNSSGHRTNIEGDYSLTGVGVIKSEDDIYYFTQIFVRE